MYPLEFLIKINYGFVWTIAEDNVADGFVQCNDMIFVDFDRNVGARLWLLSVVPPQLILITHLPNTLMASSVSVVDMIR